MTARGRQNEPMRSRVVLVVVSALSGLIATSCASPSEVTECDGRVPVALVTQTVREEADVVGSLEGANLSVDIDATIAVLDRSAEQAPDNVVVEIGILTGALTGLRDSLAAVEWDLQTAATDSGVRAAMDAIDQPAVQTANMVVESYLATRCGAATADVPGDGSAETLPNPTVVDSVPDDPPMGVVDNESDASALGAIVAISFGLDLPAEKLTCLGEKLQELVDVSGASSSTRAYLHQFQAAFDACAITFTVPVE